MLISNYITPVMHVDPNGEFFVGLMISMVIGGLIAGLTSLTNMEDDDQIWATFCSGFINGALTTLVVTIGIAISGPAGIVFAVVGGFGSGFLSSTLNDRFHGREVDKEKRIINGLYNGFMAGLLATGLMYTTMFKAPSFSARLSLAVQPEILGVGVGVLLNYPIPKSETDNNDSGYIYFDYSYGGIQ